jgi:hypothetical protein
MAKVQLEIHHFGSGRYMQKIAKLIFSFTFTWIFFCSSLSYANTFNFNPIGSLPTFVQAGQTVSAIYNVSSAGVFLPGKYHIIFAMLSNPENVTQDLSVAYACQLSPINPSGCLLKLDITGPVFGPVKICDDLRGRPGLSCNIPSLPSDFLNVEGVQPSSLSALVVSPISTILGPNGSQQFIVVNTSSSIAAQNVTMTIPANVQGQLTGLPVYSGCTLIAALGTCTITITAVASPNAQSGTATVQGSNTAAPAPTVAITTGAAPALTVSPISANINFDDTQIFTVTNIGSITAQNISMTLPANVQNQLVGPPIYSSGCTSLAPGSSACTITIQAISAPSSQSGIGTVQGTNTAAPAPQVNIFILSACSVLGATTVSNTGLSVITGGVCVAPGVAITGFPPGQTVPAGQLHSNDAIATIAHSDAVNLFGSIGALTCDNPLVGDLGGLTLPPGVYCFTAGATLVAGGTLILDGAATDQWYFQIGSTLTTGANSNVTLIGGALPGNVYWQIGSSATFGANTAFIGQVVAFTSLTVGAGTSNNGRLWVVNAAITLDTNSVGP